jgi:hypothetical protein
MIWVSTCFSECHCENEHTTTHDILWDILTTMVLKIGTHVRKEVFHPLRCYHNWFDLLECGTMCVVHDNACNDNCHSRENTIITKVRIGRWLHSSFHRDLWLSSFLFQLLFYFLCSRHYSLSLAILLNFRDSYFLLLTTCVQSPPMYKSHYDFSMCRYVWEAFHISSRHHTQCTSIASWFVTNNTFLVYNPLLVY